MRSRLTEQSGAANGARKVIRGSHSSRLHTANGVVGGGGVVKLGKTGTAAL